MIIESNIEGQLSEINKKLDRLTNPAKLAGLQFIAGFFHSLGNIFFMILITIASIYLFSSLNLGEYLNKYIQTLLPQPKFTIQNQL